MTTKIYYGEYPLSYWIKLLLQGDIELPSYQRYFAWDEDGVKSLMQSFTENQFVPAVTIGAFKQVDIETNLIIDGQQRLTSILLAYLDIYPDSKGIEVDDESYINDEDVEYEEDEDGNKKMIKWRFSLLTNLGKQKEEIVKNVKGCHTLNLKLDEDFFNTHYLGFSYIVHQDASDKEQQQYYSTLFRNMNLFGVRLLPTESRESLYYLNVEIKDWFAPSFQNLVSITLVNKKKTKMDYVRYCSLLAQYLKCQDINKVARGYKTKMEQYYELYIYSVVNNKDEETFGTFDSIIPNRDYAPFLLKIKQVIETLGLEQMSFKSIIDVDMYMFGLINAVVYEKREIDLVRQEALKIALNNKIHDYKNGENGEDNQSKSPSAFKYLRKRIQKSIDIYQKFLK